MDHRRHQSTLLRCLLPLLLWLPAAAAAPGEREQLWTLLQNLDQDLSAVLEQPRRPALLTPLESCAEDSPRQHLAAALEREAQARDSDQGLRLNGFYTSEDMRREDGDSGRGFVELSWDLLDGGVIGNNREAALLRSRAELESLLAADESAAQRLRCQRDRVHELFAPLRLDVQSLSLRLLEPVYDYERDAYLRGWSHLDEFLVSERDLLLARRDVSYLSGIARRVTAGLPPVIDIDMAALMAAIASDDREQRLRELGDEVDRARYEAAQRQRLRVFLRQEIDGSGDPDDVVAGLRFSVPLGAPRSVALEERRRYNDASAALAGARRSAIVRSAYLEVREQLERVIDAHYALQRSRERARRSLAGYRLNGRGDLPVAITRLKAMLEGAHTVAAAQEVLYRKILETLTHARVPYEARFLTPVPLEPALRGRGGHRALYLWSAAFNDTPNPRLRDIAAARRIDRLSVSAGDATDADKLRALLAMPRRPQVELLLGDVGWLREDRAEAARQRILHRIDSLAGGRDIAVHLDIEPQQHPDYSRQRGALLASYLGFMRQLRRELPLGVALHLSVPAHWDDEVYRALNELADELYVMAYGMSAQRSLDRALVLQDSVAPHKLRWTLRAADFSSGFALESRLQDLQRRVGLTRFAIHDYRDWLALQGADDASP